VVYRARHLLLDRPVARQAARPQYLSDDRAVKRFMREAQAMARVEHPKRRRDPRLRALPEGGAYLVMEHVEGETLRAVLSRVGSLPVADAVAITEQICGAVDAAHRQGVVHRDLKPENIMFKADRGRRDVKVLDFGLAKVVDTVTSDGHARAHVGRRPLRHARLHGARVLRGRSGRHGRGRLLDRHRHLRDARRARRRSRGRCRRS
jgi:serine/threonine-protein kinase